MPVLPLVALTRTSPGFGLGLLGQRLPGLGHELQVLLLRLLLGLFVSQMVRSKSDFMTSRSPMMPSDAPCAPV